MSQQTVIRNPASLSLLSRGKKGEIRKRKKNKKELGLVVSQQTVIRNQGLVVSQLSLLERGKRRGKFRKRKKNKKELGRMDGRFEISSSKSPHPQILVPNGHL